MVGGFGAPPPLNIRTSGNSGVPGCARCAARYACQNTVPAPAHVTPCSARKGGVASGLKISTTSSSQPVSMALNIHTRPPTWVIGNTTATLSSAVTSIDHCMPRLAPAIVRSVWRAPFGSATVPEL